MKTNHLLSGVALAMLISVSGFGLTAVSAQTQTQENAQTQPSSGDSAATPTAKPDQNEGQGATAGTDQAGSATADNRLIAKVNDAEIRQADVVNAIQGLPPQIQQMPPQLLLPVVVEQLLLRELILEQAYLENLQSDPEVTAQVEPQTKALQDQAIVTVWLERELNERVTDESVAQAYEQAKAANPDIRVTLEQARPQIGEALRQQAVRDISAELREDAQIVFYDPTGNPLPQASAGAQGSSSGATEATGSANQAAPGQDGSSTSEENSSSE